MDNLREAVEILVPGENVSPDFSDYNTMVIKWRGTNPPPSLAAVNAKIAELEVLKNATEYIEEQKEKIEDDGVTDHDMIQALWDKAKFDNKEFDRIDLIREAAKVMFPKPV